MSNQRAHERLPITGTVRLYWEDERGTPHFCRAEARDLSTSGLSVTIRERVPLRALVQVELVGNPVKGIANVRRCEQRGMDYHVGLEFMGGMRQQAKPRFT